MEHQTFKYRDYDVPVHLANMTGGGPENFGEIALHHQSLIHHWIDIRPSDRVFEVGCGIGRDAIPLAETLTTGVYQGIDLIRPSIDWLNENVASKYANFSFHHLDIEDDLHHPTGKMRVEDVRLPAGARSVDKIFLFSVFTHMYRNEIGHYLKEFNRILAPGGKVFATCFFVDDAILAKARETNLTQWDLRFEHEIEPGCYINNPESPRGATAFTKGAIEAANASSGLKIVNSLNGTWSGYHEHCDDGQDVIILQKPQ